MAVVRPLVLPVVVGVVEVGVTSTGIGTILGEVGGTPLLGRSMGPLGEMPVMMRGVTDMGVGEATGEEGVQVGMPPLKMTAEVGGQQGFMVRLGEGAMVEAEWMRGIGTGEVMGRGNRNCQGVALVGVVGAMVMEPQQQLIPLSLLLVAAGVVGDMVGRLVGMVGV